MALLDIIRPGNVTMPEYYKQRTEQEMSRRIGEIKRAYGTDLFIPGHHYQKDEVIRFADTTGDSLQLAQVAAGNQKAKYIVFCGVHFMAETTDMLTHDRQMVVLPDMRAGCSMADMANLTQMHRAWNSLVSQFGDNIIPLTYVNSTADIKAFVGQHEGATVTSSNAKKVLAWALSKKARVLFLPDQHLGRNTAFDLGIPLTDMAVWDPEQEALLTQRTPDEIKIILWKGHCSVHEKFTVQNIRDIHVRDTNFRIIVHPECSRDVVAASDLAGSTKYIIDTIASSPSGSKWAIGTEMNLVNRLIRQHPDKHIVSLNPDMCPCLTMNRIDMPHLLWALERIEQDDPVGVIRVDPCITRYALLALNRMLNIV
ncbi:quinolinate synthase NadA [Xenorhabdus budapestensis]|uniref:Quinolinate synthase n=1 Tax=Xenorhabdus budapestensis TaxID=290110 RepID=A0ABX7VFT0_XENBU|nr:quinolinate synthase NadA [Xenorhabdus budapestensis]QTL38270.1 quinolinate synthase NadA [Xenorhabdus budapestensis]